jgi:hypothetical protein
MNKGKESKHRSQRDIQAKVKLLRTLYLAGLSLLFFLVVLTPYFIQGNFQLKNRGIVREEIAEGAVIALLLIVGYLASRLHKKEFDKYHKELTEFATCKYDLENRLNDAFSYIGEINVQLLEIKSVFSALQKYPESKKDYRSILIFLARKTLGIVNVDWVMFRIINPESFRTIQECSETRGSAILLKHNISNRAMVSNEAIADCSVISSEQENLTIRAFCILPTEELTESQEILIQAIVSELEMLFIVFSSEYNREGYLKKKDVFTETASERKGSQ